MKWMILALSMVTGVSAQAAKIQKLKCRAWDGTPVAIEFARPVDPLIPFTSYEFMAMLEVFSPRGVYGRADVRITPLKTTHDVELRGDVPDAIYLRLAPVMANGEFAGKYTGQVFINDLSVKAYFNFKDTGSTPGLSCEAE